MNSKKIFLRIILGVTILFLIFLLQFNKYYHHKTQQKVEHHAKIISESLWSFNPDLTKNYLKLASRLNLYKEIIVTDSSGETFFYNKYELVSPVNKILKSLSLLNTQQYKSIIYFKKRYIGQISILAFNTSIYLYFYIFIILVLILIAIWFFLVTFQQKQDLENIVFKRTKDLKNEIKNREQAQIALAQETERLLVTLRSIGDAVITTDINGKITMINNVAELLTGCSYIDALGKKTEEIFTLVNTETRQKCENSIEKVLNIKKTVNWDKQVSLISTNNTERIITNSTSPIFNDLNEIIGVVLVFKDITEKIKNEFQIQQAQKMEAIGQLAGGLAHDFNNMLGAIIGNISYALSITNETNKLYEIITDIQDSSKQAQELTRQLLTFSTGGAPIKNIFNINKILKKTTEFTVRGTNVNCLFQLQNNLSPVEIDKAQINQVIGNLIINANQAMPKGGTLIIATDNILIDENSLISLPPGKYVKIKIEDHGIGISKKHISNIFEPYFTTKQEGNGLGLATSYSIIKRHGGHIEVTSELEKGTIFNIFLPASTKKIEEVKKIVLADHKGNGNILIMDDQASILKMFKRILEHMGYQVTCAVNGEETLKYYKDALSTEKRYDLVILDLTIPGGLGGADTIKELLKIDPKIKAIVSSGYSNDPVMANYKDYGFCDIVAKPYTRTRLIEVLNRVFNNQT